MAPKRLRCGGGRRSSLAAAGCEVPLKFAGEIGARVEKRSSGESKEEEVSRGLLGASPSLFKGGRASGRRGVVGFRGINYAHDLHHAGRYQ
jgi:hypothetical protein